MTGQVKEDILSRFIEMGVRVNEGQIIFEPSMLDPNEFCETESELIYWNFATKQLETIVLEPGSFGFTFCGVPIIYRATGTAGMRVCSSDGQTDSSEEFVLNADQCDALFARNGKITRIELDFDA